MRHENPIDVVEWRLMLETVADRFENEVYRIVGHVAVAAAEVQTTASRLAAGGAAGDGGLVGTSHAAAEQVSVGLHSIATSASELSRSVDQVVRQMTAAARQARSSAEGAGGTLCDVDQLVQAVLLTREIDTMVTDVAALTNLLAVTLTVEATHAGNDLAAATFRVRSLANQAVRATEEIGWQIVEIQQRVARAAANIAVPVPAPGGVDLTTAVRAA